MGGTGWLNPYPFAVGGAPTETERVYAFLRAAVGKGGSATDDDDPGTITTIEGLWRRARAAGIASVSRDGERAALQAFPNVATDLLDYYEQTLGITPPIGSSDEARRQVATTRYTEQIDATVAALEADLQRIDSRFSIVAVGDDETETTQHGRAFEDLAATEPFNGGRQSTQFPNYSTEFVVFVLFSLGAGVAPSLAERRLLEEAKELLVRVLPAWVTFQFFTELGFNLDIDLLDLTGLNP